MINGGRAVFIPLPYNLHEWISLLLSSYLHCEWASLSQLEKDKRIHQKIKRFKTKHAQMRHLQEVSGAGPGSSGVET